MTSQVDFYVLQSSDEQSRLRTVCRLADKVHRMGHNIHILTTDSTQSKKLDDFMWTFSQSSFLPHSMADESDPYQAQQPVLIHHQPLNSTAEVLINLQPDPANTDNYQRLVEIVNQDAAVRTAGRNKYRSYVDKNYPIKTHKL